MAGRHPRVLERAVVPHAQALHHRDRAAILGRGERHDLVQACLVEPEIDRRTSSLGRLAVAPVRKRKPPPDLDTGREAGFERGPLQTDEADERRYSWNLYCPQAHALGGE